MVKSFFSFSLDPLLELTLYAISPALAGRGPVGRASGRSSPEWFASFYLVDLQRVEEQEIAEEQESGGAEKQRSKEAEEQRSRGTGDSRGEGEQRSRGADWL